jgi:uncharacterized protein (DUF934 family)
MDKPDYRDESPLAGETALVELSLADWLSAGCPSRSCVIVDGAAQLEGCYAQLLSPARIVIHFPVFMDGRGFSHARKLRELGFAGELVAGGDVLPDQWPFLKRCGFDGLLDPARTEEAEGLPDFSDAYQADVLQSQPLFRRRRSV